MSDTNISVENSIHLREATQELESSEISLQNVSSPDLTGTNGKRMGEQELTISGAGTECEPLKFSKQLYMHHLHVVRIWVNFSDLDCGSFFGGGAGRRQNTVS